jgi:hypothetical protein
MTLVAMAGLGVAGVRWIVNLPERSAIRRATDNMIRYQPGFKPEEYDARITQRGETFWELKFVNKQKANDTFTIGVLAPTVFGGVRTDLRFPTVSTSGSTPGTALPAWPAPSGSPATKMP